MAIAVVDDRMLREPRLLVPGMQPVGLVKIDWSNPLSKGCRFFFAPAISKNDLTKNSRTVRPGSGELVAITELPFAMRGMQYTTNADLRSEFTCPYGLGVKETILFIGDFPTTGYKRIFSRDSTAYRKTILYAPPGSSKGFFAWTCDGVATPILYSSNRGGGSTEQQYFFGSYQSRFAAIPGTDSGFTLSTPTVSALEPLVTTTTEYDNWIFGAAYDGGWINDTFTLGLIVVWNRVLTKTEIALFYMNPYQFLIPA